MPKKRELTRELKKKEQSVPKLPEDTDFYHLFGTAKQKGRKKFADLVQENISDTELGKALKEKRVGSPDHAEKKQQKIPPPQAFLDLHGYTAREAEKETENFIRQAVKQGLLSLCIITGKGLHSQGEGVLRDLVESQLIGLKKSKAISSFRWEKKTKQKSGAILVFLH